VKAPATNHPSACISPLRLIKGVVWTAILFHRSIERIPEAGLLTARRFLEYLVVSPALRAAQAAPVENEEVTPADEEAMRRSHADIDAGRISLHDHVLREFWLR
jgi:hypothetical protein